MGFCRFVDHSLPLLSSFRDGATGRSCSCSTRVDFLRGNCTDPIGTDLRDLPPSNEQGSSISFRPIIRRSHYGPRISLSKKIVVMIVTMIFFLSFSSGTIKMIFAWIFHIPRFLSRFFLFFLKIYLDLQLRSYNFDFSRIKFKGYSLGLIV